MDEVLKLFSHSISDREDPADAEPNEQAMEDAVISMLTSTENATTRLPGLPNGQRGGQRAPELTPDILRELRPYVINLNQGRFSSSGIFDTTPGDVDKIFNEHLVKELEAAKANNRKLRVMFYAHGGLTPEVNGLWTAHNQVSWWQKNHIYPIYFVWETGFLETLGQLLSGAEQRMQRAVGRDIWDFTSDPMIEELVRQLGCVQIWSGMKRSAERSVQQQYGGAWYVADKLKAFCDAHPGEVELHAVGHSAGAIFHAHFVSAALAMGVQQFQSMHFLAPAIRVDTFEELLAQRLGKDKGVNHLSIFTMNKDWEKADSVWVYRKSLLYLIERALEPERNTSILGLEEPLRGDRYPGQRF